MNDDPEEPDFDVLWKDFDAPNCLAIG